MNIKLKATRLVLVALLVEQLTQDPKFKGSNTDEMAQ
jgi:hypothetical protein